MDKKDLEILKAIADSKTTHRELISEETGIAKSTVHYRINKLREEGVIKNDLGELELDELGFEMMVITNVTAEYNKGYAENISQKIAKIEGVAHVFWVMGDVDYVVISHLSDQAELQRLFDSFHSIEGIKETNSTQVVEIVKNEPNPLSNYELERINDIHDFV